jgi:hypothetical protein
MAPPKSAFTALGTLSSLALAPFVVSLGLEAACGRGSLGARSFALLARGAAHLQRAQREPRLTAAQRALYGGLGPMTPESAAP